MGAFVEEREKIIEDEFAESGKEEHAAQEAQIRCEQSDMLMFLMNISFIPDAIIYQNIVRDFEPGWQFYIKQAMENYKEDFNKNVVAEDGTTNVQWKQVWYKC